MLAFWFVSLRRTHDAKRHISTVRPCASIIVNELNPQGFDSFTIIICFRKAPVKNGFGFLRHKSLPMAFGFVRNGHNHKPFYR